MNGSSIKQSILFSGIFLSLVFAPGIFAATTGDVITFNVEARFEASENARVEAVLIKDSANLYVYVEKKWWDAQVPAKQSEIITSLNDLTAEFSGNIYPTLTSVFGSEWRPGVDGDNKITLLFHAMKEGAAGYFRSADEYLKLQVPGSNEREMLYLALANIENPQVKNVLAHEFTHLITFNQKDRLRGVTEETWLDEARADYAPTILGYGVKYDGSNLQGRVRDFLANPSDSLTEWQGKKHDYGVASVFTHYLVDHYGITVLSDSLKLPSVGIASINEVLAKNGYQETFAQIFTNWTVAAAINNCSVGLHYCYLSQNLHNLRVSPTLNFLPLTGNSSLSVTNVTKNWAGTWQKIIGGNGNLTLEFSGLPGVNFKVPYLIFDKENNYTVNFLALDKNQKGKISIADFGQQYSSLIIIPLLQDKTAGFSESEFTYPYTFKATISGQVTEEDPALILQLLQQIESLKKQIAALQALRPGGGGLVLCSEITANLYVGVENPAAVKCLQQFLKNQGPAIYPEGLVTGNFFSLTRAAAMRFQQKYSIIATGYVGILTRTKINELLP